MNRTFSIEDMKSLAASKGGRCISSKYINTKTKLKWVCEKGHVFEATPEVILRGSWCYECKHNNDGYLEKLKLLANRYGGQCLSDTYTNSKRKLRWACKKGHIFDATPNSVSNGRWCPVCGRISASDKKRGTIDDMNSLADINDGVCLSTKYIDSKTNLKWRCKYGHEWMATPNNIQQGCWCPICSQNSKLNQDD